jgi:hypothetical protein
MVGTLIRGEGVDASEEILEADAERCSDRSLEDASDDCLGRREVDRDRVESREFCDRYWPLDGFVGESSFGFNVTDVFDSRDDATWRWMPTWLCETGFGFDVERCRGGGLSSRNARSLRASRDSSPDKDASELSVEDDWAR